MSKELKIIENNMSFSELQNQMNQIMVIQQNQLHKMITELKDGQKKIEEKMEIRDLEEESLREVILKDHRVKEHRYGFVGLGDLGQIFTVSIGSITMGKLLRLAGLAKTKQTKTEPLRSAIINNYAKSFMYGDYPSYQWNPARCIEKIERWLDKEGILDEFYAIGDEKELTKYIGDLYAKYDI